MVYYRNPKNQQVYGYDPETQQNLIDQAIANGYTLVPVWPLPPTDDQLKAQCKQTASSLLYETDWTTIPDVANPANNPYLTNQAAFISWRSQVRQIAVTPIAGNLDIFLQMPQEDWKTV